MPKKTYKDYEKPFVDYVIGGMKLQEGATGLDNLRLFLGELYEHEFGEKKDLITYFSSRVAISKKDLKYIMAAFQKIIDEFDVVNQEIAFQAGSARNRQNFDVHDRKKQIIKPFEGIIYLFVDTHVDHYVHGVGNNKEIKTEEKLVNDQFDFILSGLCSMKGKAVSFYNKQQEKVKLEQEQPFNQTKEPLLKIFNDDITKDKQNPDSKGNYKVFLTKDELNILLQQQDENKMSLNSRLVDFMQNKKQLPITDYIVERNELISSLLLAAREIDKKKKSKLFSFDKKNDLEARLTSWFETKSGMQPEALLQIIKKLPVIEDKKTRPHVPR